MLRLEFGAVVVAVTLFESALLAQFLQGEPTRGALVDERTLCQKLVDLAPEGSDGDAERRLAEKLLRWAAAAGDTLELTFLGEESGLYRLALYGISGEMQATAHLWDQPLSAEGETSFRLGDRTLPLRFDPVLLGPGRHILTLTAESRGNVLLDCLAIRRISEFVPAPDASTAKTSGRAFLGVEIGRGTDDGVTLKGVIPGSAAARAGLEPGDVVLSIAGEPVRARERLTDVIAMQRPGDSVALVVARSGQRLELSATLGHRGEASGRDRSRSDLVAAVLDVRPGEVIADIGCGSGWLSEMIAGKVGMDGLVYAVEIDQKDIRRLRRSAPANMMPVLSTRDDVSLPEDSLDTAMLHDVASHVHKSSRPRFYASIARALKPTGKLVIFGPHDAAREMLDDVRSYGFVPINERELDALSPKALDERLWEGIVLRFEAE